MNEPSCGSPILPDGVSGRPRFADSSVIRPITSGAASEPRRKAPPERLFYPFLSDLCSTIAARIGALGTGSGKLPDDSGAEP